MEKSKVDGKVCSSGRVSHELASSTGENVTNVQNSKDVEVSTVSSERVYSVEQSSIKTDFSSEARQPVNGKRSNLDSFVTHHSKVLKTDSSSESGEVIQLSSVDSTDPIPCHSSKEIFSESNVVSHERESSIVTKLDSTVTKFDLNEGTEVKGAISVVAKVGVPVGSPKKPLQFGGELGWKRSGSVSAFRPASFKLPKIENESYDIRGIDLNLHPCEESQTDLVSSKPPERFMLDLNIHSEDEYNCRKPGPSSFDLNDNPEDTRNSLFPGQSENQHLLRSVGVDNHGGVISRGNNSSRPMFNMRRPPPSYWVDLSSMRGIGHVQTQPFIVATTTPTPEQMQMMATSGLYIGKINNVAPNFYPPNVLPHLNNHHVIGPVSQMPGPVLAAYPGPLHLVENQGINPHAYANMRPSFIPNGGIPLMEDGHRGAVRNALFEAREKAVEQINSRQMASWK